MFYRRTKDDMRMGTVDLWKLSVSKTSELETPLGDHPGKNSNLDKFHNKNLQKKQLNKTCSFRLELLVLFKKFGTTAPSCPEFLSSPSLAGIGLDLLSGTGVTTALSIVQWPTLFLTRP